VKTIQIEVEDGEGTYIEVEKDGPEYVVTAWVPFVDCGDSKTLTNKQKAIALAKKWAKEISSRYAETDADRAQDAARLNKK